MRDARPAPVVHAFHWLGDRAPHLDAPAIDTCGPVAIGRYGGCRATGADKNEDGALVWCAADGAWEFALLLDAHASAESAALVLATVAGEERAIAALLGRPIATAFGSLERHLLVLFGSPDFRARCQRVRGETACLICARKAGFLWWFSVGDCAAYLLHPELAALGQVALNQRHFYEWIGRVGTFDLAVPCYTRGVRELRAGRNTVVMATDGLLECGARPFDDPGAVYRWFAPPHPPGEGGLAGRVRAALLRVQGEQGRDSATVIAWHHDNPQAGARPSR